MSFQHKTILQDNLYNSCVIRTHNKLFIISIGPYINVKLNNTIRTRMKFSFLQVFYTIRD